MPSIRLGTDRPASTDSRGLAPREALALALRGLGALAVLATGADHLYEYTADGFSAVPTIGTLFLLNVIGATAIGVPLLLPLGRLLPESLRAHARAARELLALGGIGLAATSLVSLWISETSSLFGFTDAGLRPPILAAIAAEAVAILALGGHLVLEHARARRPRGEPLAARRAGSAGARGG